MFYVKLVFFSVVSFFVLAFAVSVAIPNAGVAEFLIVQAASVLVGGVISNNVGVTRNG